MVICSQRSGFEIPQHKADHETEQEVLEINAKVDTNTLIHTTCVIFYE